MTIYLLLLHGRDDPNEDMEYMGYEGPLLGPFKAIHCTYTAHVNCIDEHGEMVLELVYHEDMLVHDGKFYGDFEIAADFRGQK